MALTGRFDADFQPFLDAVQQANKSLATLEASAKQVGVAVDQVAEGKGWVSRIAESDLLTEAINHTLAALEELVAYFPELAERGSVVGDVEESFKHLTAQIGLTADVLLGDLRAGTHNTVDDFTLMKRVNEDIAAGLHLTEDQFRLLADASFALAKATGGDVTESLDKMSEALVRGQPRALAALTGKIDLKAAEQDYAASLEGTGRQLDAEGKLEVDRETMLKRIGAALDALGPQQDSLKDKVEQAHTAWANFQDDLGKAIAKSPVLAAGLDALSKSLTDAFGPDKGDLIKQIATLVDEAAVVVVDFGLAAVGVAGVIHEAWSVLETLFETVLAIVVGGVDGVLHGWAKLAEGANAISSHIVSDQTIANLKTTVAWMDDFADAEAHRVAETAKGIIGNSAFDASLAKLGGTLFQTRDALLAAQAAMDKQTTTATASSEATTKAAKSQEDLNTQLVPSTEYTKQYLAAWDELNKTGEDYAATVAAMNPQLVEQINYYLKAGASVKLLADAYPQLSAAQIAAVDALRKERESADLSVTLLTNQLNEIVGSGGQTAYEKAEAAVDKWYADDVAKHQASKTDTAAYYDAVTKLDDARYAQLATNRLAADKESKTYLENQAHAAEEAYQFALAQDDQFTQAHIEKLRQAADASRLAADNWSSDWATGASTAAAAVDKVTDALNRTATAMGQLRPAGATDEQQALAAVMQQVDASNIGQMIKAGTTNTQLMGAYEAAIDAGMAARGFAAARASGGPVSAGAPYLVGEQGPELFVPTAGGTILPNGGGVTVVNHFHIVDTEAGITRRVSDTITRSILQGRKLA